MTNEKDVTRSKKIQFNARSNGRQTEVSDQYNKCFTDLAEVLTDEANQMVVPFLPKT